MTKNRNGILYSGVIVNSLIAQICEKQIPDVSPKIKKYVFRLSNTHIMILILINLEKIVLII